MKRATLLFVLLASCLAGSMLMMSGASAAPPGKALTVPTGVPKPGTTPLTPGNTLTVPPGVPKPGPVPLTPAPDLVVTGFGARPWVAPCAPGQSVYKFVLGVKNQGNASWTSGSTLAAVRDLHPGVSWGVSVVVNPPLAPGQTRDLEVLVPYYAANPDHMANSQGHPFEAFVNENHTVAESNYANNAAPGGTTTWNGVSVINMASPANCTIALSVPPGVAKPGPTAIAPGNTLAVPPGVPKP
jgi:hypothetical protein